MAAKDEYELVGVGIHFEDLPVGRKFKTLRRTVMDADICAFINVIHMTESLFTDMEFIKNESDIKGRLAPGAQDTFLRLAARSGETGVSEAGR